MLIEFNVKNDKLICNKEYIIAGCKNYYTLKAVFSNDWDGLDKFLTIAGYSPPIAFDENNIVTLPPFSKGEVNIAVLGKKQDDIIVATSYHKFYVQEGAVEDYSSPPSPDVPATWATYIGELAANEIEEIKNAAKRAHGYTWYVNTDNVIDKTGKSYGTMSDCMTDDFVGTWFYVRTTSSEAGSATYPSKYTIDGANGYINLRDYVVWTGKRLVRVNTYEAKSSTLKNPDGKYSPKSGVDGLMSSVDKAYLTDLINEYWGKNKLPIYPDPDPAEGWMCNWCRDTGIYAGGLKKDCGGHPPVLNDNHTSWVLMVFNGMATDAESLSRNHRLQIAFDLVNSKIYMRRGWMSSNEWVDWSEVGGADNNFEVTSHTEAGMINWLTGEGVHYATLQAGNAKNPLPDDEGLEYIVYVGKEFNGSSLTGNKFQLAVHLKSGRKFYRCGSVPSGGSFGAYSWTEIETGGTTGEKSDVLIVTDDMAVKEYSEYHITINLTTDIKEVVVQSGYSTRIHLPEDAWAGWRCIINASGLYGSDGIYVYSGDTQLGIAAPSNTYMVVYNRISSETAELVWEFHGVDNIYRTPI